MAGDIVKQLRDTRYLGQLGMRLEAADEIERLRLQSVARKWDEGEHEGCGKDTQRALDRQTLEALTIQNIEYHDHIRYLEEALEKIACRHITEQPLWWQLEARATLSSTDNSGAK